MGSHVGFCELLQRQTSWTVFVAFADDHFSLLLEESLFGIALGTHLAWPFMAFMAFVAFMALVFVALAPCGHASPGTSKWFHPRGSCASRGWSTSGKTSGGTTPNSCNFGWCRQWTNAVQAWATPWWLPAWSPAGWSSSPWWPLWMPWPSWPSCPSWPGWSSWKSWPWLEQLVAGSWGTQWQAGQQLAAQ